jgi:uncharacterized protein (TIGR01777 family)
MCRESDPPGDDFLARVCEAWEGMAQPAESLVDRLVIFRIGVVLSKKGGALPKLLQPPVVAPLGSGKQFMSTIHLDDLVAMMYFAMQTEKVRGVYNAVGPEALSNKDFSRLAAKVAAKPYLPVAVPGFGLKLLLGEMSQVVLGGNKVSAEKIKEAGYVFRFPTVEGALNAELINKK